MSWSYPWMAKRNLPDEPMAPHDTELDREERRELRDESLVEQ
jgi:hypothetical protein